MARLRYNGLVSALGGALTSSGTTVTFSAALTSASGAVPTIAGTDYIPLTILTSTGAVSEIVYLTAYTTGATTGTIARGKEGTAAVAHATGDSAINAGTTLDAAKAIGAIAYSTTATSIPNAVYTMVPLELESYDSDGFHSTTTNNTRLTIPTGLDGAYIVTGCPAYQYVGTGTRAAAIYVNGTIKAESGSLDSFSSAPRVTFVGFFAGGDYIELGTWQNSGGAAPLQTGGLTQLTLMRIGS